MYQDQSNSLAVPLPSVLDGGWGGADLGLSRLLGTVVSDAAINADGILELKGRDRTGEERWRLGVSGSARFTFAHEVPEKSWLVEVNFDSGGFLRSSDRTMIHAICGAEVECFQAQEEGLLIRSDDGRAIEVPYALNEDGIVINILPQNDYPSASRIVLPVNF